MLAREVLRMRGTISREHLWEVMPDLPFYRDPEEIEKEEQSRLERLWPRRNLRVKGLLLLPCSLLRSLRSQTGLKAQVPSVPSQLFPTEDWRAQPAPEDWSAAPTTQAPEWVGTATEWPKLLFHKVSTEQK
uniref:Small ribosomal subunit protein uS2 C-terminal domain-containing protein n=1 Tax=Pipistrellus kuhlii TaxID=59472 RepID=A0A7J7ZK62_PIPKU|nr:hypothetical protein mPipKuh1_009644 [Pipistrellus kuhlii]